MTLSLLPLSTENISYTEKVIHKDGTVPLQKKKKSKAKSYTQDIAYF